ncbi:MULTISPECIES: hypothetical protein [Bacillaceae]|uniref:hypothetical protein n=1 Tax=Bacillaceae TaxID=186817 RepID=UPI000AF5966A|nr:MULTISPECIES: hypothetical protein [Bacillaceae]
MNDKVIEQYQNDEKMMINLYAQWCVNHEIDAVKLYKQAYPSQQDNELLVSIIDDTEKNSLQVNTDTLLQVLQLFGNDDLAFEVSQAALKQK